MAIKPPTRLSSMNPAQLLHNPTSSQYHTWTRWGRVGERGQHALLGTGSIFDAQSQFEKKFKDKTGLKWADRAGEVKVGKCE
jgi:poly [ADP-ribose] polymerase